MQDEITSSMKVAGLIGITSVLLCCTVLYGQQSGVHVLRASAESFESSSNPHAAHLAVSVVRVPSPTALEQVTAGNAWIRSAGLGEPATNGTLSTCSQAGLQTAELSETPGGGLALRNFSLHGEFTRDHMMAVARNFVPSKSLPDAPSYTPLSSRDKFEGWAHHTYSTDMLMGTVFDTLTLQATGAFRDYGGGMQGFTKRYGTQLLSNEAGSLFGRWLFPTILHQDPRYFPSTQTKVFDRMAYAVSRAVITRSDNGGNVFNSSLLLTLLVTSALNNGYKPNYDESFRATMANTFAGLGGTAQMNLLNEFWPDLKQIFTHHGPGKYITHEVNRLTSPDNRDQQ